VIVGAAAAALPDNTGKSKSHVTKTVVVIRIGLTDFLAYGCFMHIAPVHLSPKEHDRPQLPQFELSLMNDALLTHDPMQDE